MGTTGVSKTTLYVLNTVYAILGLGIAAASIWFFCQVNEFTSLRNKDHYLLDYKVYWPQAIPWIFFIVSVFVIGACVCGFTSAKKKSRGVIKMYIIVQSFVILCLIAAGVIALVFADSKSTEDFVTDTVWDVYFQSKTDNEVANAFGNIEKKLHCCGAESPRDYKNWKNEFPQSCCDVFYHGWLEPYTIECEFSNKLANERHGCSKVSARYARIAIEVFAGVSFFTALIGIITVVFAVTLSKSLRKKNQPPVQYESESKKVLL